MVAMPNTLVTRAAGYAVASYVLTAAIPAAAKTLVYCSEGSPEGFNPSLYTSGTTFDASAKQIFNRLVEFERGTTNLVPALADSWEISSDGLVYTFHLRPEIAFHTTTNFTPTRTLSAEDVVFSFARQWRPGHPFHRVSGGGYEYFHAMDMANLLADVEQVSEHVIRFTLTRPEAPMLANLAMNFASIHSAEYAAKALAAGNPQAVDLAPVGTGPFQLVAYQKDAVIRYRAHPGYWAGKAPIDNLVFAITPDASVRYAKLKTGECHVMPYPNPADIAAMERDQDITLMRRDGLNVGYLAFNTRKKPFDDRRVRQAINHAIDKSAILDAIYRGGAVPAKNPIPPTVWSYDDSVADYRHDPERARALLAEAGHSDGFTAELWAMPVQRPYNPNARRMAEMMQADLAAIGITVRVVSYEWGEYLKRSRAGEHQMILLGWTGDNGDPDNFLHVLLGCAAVDGANRARWCHKPFDDLVTTAKRTTDRDQRIVLYQQAQRVFKQEAPWMPIAHALVFEPVRNEVIGYRIDPFGGHLFYGVDLR